jgi:hypothetical protein
MVCACSGDDGVTLDAGGAARFPPGALGSALFGESRLAPPGPELGASSESDEKNDDGGGLDEPDARCAKAPCGAASAAISSAAHTIPPRRRGVAPRIIMGFAFRPKSRQIQAALPILRMKPPCPEV